jgi:hypothetical protein
MTEEHVHRSSHFKQLRWSLQGLATAGSDQQPLFPDQTLAADQLAADFDHWAAVVRDNYAAELSATQIEALQAIDCKLASISKDGAEFDVELWTDAALRTSEHWEDVRRLASAALEAFEWPVERLTPTDATSSDTTARS